MGRKAVGPVCCVMHVKEPNVFSLGQARVSYLHMYAGHKVIEAGSGTRCSLTEFTASGTDVLLFILLTLVLRNSTFLDMITPTRSLARKCLTMTLKLTTELCGRKYSTWSYMFTRKQGNSITQE